MIYGVTLTADARSRDVMLQMYPFRHVPAYPSIKVHAFQFVLTIFG